MLIKLWNWKWFVCILFVFLCLRVWTHHFLSCSCLESSLLLRNELVCQSISILLCLIHLQRHTNGLILQISWKLFYLFLCYALLPSPCDISSFKLFGTVFLSQFRGKRVMQPPFLSFFPVRLSTLRCLQSQSIGNVSCKNFWDLKYVTAEAGLHYTFWWIGNQLTIINVIINSD